MAARSGRGDDPPAGDRRPAVAVPDLPARFQLLEPLAEGGTSTVWAGRDRAAGRDVVVKVVPLPAGAGAAGREDLAARVESEVRALARLRDHPGLATVRAAGVGPQAAWVVSDRVAGPTLAAVAAAGPMDAVAVARIGAGVAAALAAAHGVGVVHGDLSPANVVLAPGGSGACPAVVVDLGLASVDGATAPRGGTPGVLAPERAAGGPPTRAGDVFGLAATLWTVWDGAAPVPSPDPPPHLEGHLARLLAGALERAPDRRPSARSLARALRGLPAGRPPGAAR